MPIWGRKKKQAQEALSSAKALIIKIKRRGIDTHEAETLYKTAKKAVKNRRYKEALAGIEEAEKSAKIAYARGIKERLEQNISGLSKNIKEMQEKNLDTAQLDKFLKDAKASLKGGVKDYKKGLKSAKEGLKTSEEELEKYDNTSRLLSSTASMLRRIEDFSPDISLLEDIKKKLEMVEALKIKGKIEKALKKAKKLETGVKRIKARYSKAYESIKALEKAMQNAEVLEANISADSQMQSAKTLLKEGEFEKVCEIADKSCEELSGFLKHYKDAKYHVDTAKEKVLEAKSWGFSAFEAERSLSLALDALKNNEFEDAITKSKEAQEKASTIRERHRHSLELIQSAKDEIEKKRAKGIDIPEMEEKIKEAEDEFYKGDYGAAEEKIGRVFEAVRDKD